MPAEPAAVTQPERPLYALTTYELTYYRRRLENALAFLDKQDPVPPIRADANRPRQGDRRAGRPGQDRR
jgi:hypothetical protein